MLDMRGRHIDPTKPMRDTQAEFEILAAHPEIRTVIPKFCKRAPGDKERNSLTP
jgi:hypothetical protein